MAEHEGSPAGWEFWIDRGGTFTDIVARDPKGRLHTHKLLSANPERYRDAAVAGIRELLGLRDPDQAIAPGTIASVKMGTTVATNALLERAGTPTVLAITEGFADVLRIGDQHRPRLFDRHIVLPSLLHTAVAEIAERVDARGQVLRPLDLDQVRAALAPARAAGIEAVAIVLVHGWRFGAHERAVAEVAAAMGFSQISVSHEVSPLAKLVGRGDTTVVDAYLSPVLRRYVEQVSAALGALDGGLLFMQSNGGLTHARSFRGKDAILSGPAGGIVGAVATSAQAKHARIVGFDMGGTSTDVAHYAGLLERSFETEVAGVRVRAPMLEIHTVAAGGGSICRFEHGRLRVGPESAGAVPGPACYRRGGPLTITDCNVMLGKLQPRRFPAVFGPGGDQPIDAEVVRERFAELAQAVAADTGEAPPSPERLATGLIEIAVASMAGAIKKISIERGHDLEHHALCCFGGAGGQHACLVAEALDMRTVLIHPFAGVLSAYGMGLADLRAMRERSAGVALDARAEALAELAQALAELAEQAQAQLLDQGVDPGTIELERGLMLRYAGSDRPLRVDWSPAEDAAATMRASFEREHRQRYGFALATEAVIVDALVVEAVAPGHRVDALETDGGAAPDPAAPELAAPREWVELWTAGERVRAPVLAREALAPGRELPGPAIIAEATGTTIVEPGWTATVLDTGHLRLTRAHASARLAASADTEAELRRPDPVRLEVFNNLFGSIAERMGATLRNTAHSVNIKERLDFSCAVFDGEGMLIANAPHMPVHLGSMGASVRAVITHGARPRPLHPGDVYVVNAPYNGGTHLPDVTLISPVFIDAPANAAKPDFFVASRGHHADIGGISPGSMPAHSRHVDEEGVLFDGFLLVDGALAPGQLRREALLERLCAGPWPARDPKQNLADLEAQLAANVEGARELEACVARWTLPLVRAYMGHVRRNAAAAVGQALARLVDREAQTLRFRQAMDDGSEIAVAITIEPHREGGARARVDFAGTSAQRPNNFNAPLAVCQAAVLYVFRTLVDADIPLNEGCLDPIELVVPEGCMLHPRYPAAVVAGNVETSQAVCDALFGALGVMAASQGTMNNLTFGNADYQYYETVCGGSGAGPTFPGTDAVHTHMTNSRLTDVEILEQRYPVLVEAFEIRRGSGGAGRQRGGDGVRRRLRFLDAMELIILANRRTTGPYGVDGGRSGAPGRAWIEREGGARQALAFTDRARVEAGDRFVLETPGGGGWGSPEASSLERTKTQNELENA